jgi:Fe-S cluster assembly ATP-binding protein
MLKLEHIIIKKDEKSIIKDISIDIEEGNIHYLMGPNGSGKSTLALAIAGYPEYNIEGNIFFKNENIIELSPDKRAKLGLFLSMQYPPAIKGVSILSLIKNAYQAINGPVNVLEFRTRVVEEVKRLGLDESILSRGVNEGFSGGERKRLELLQLLILKPKLAILDEPDSGLDIDALKLMSSELKQLNQNGMTFIIITHQGQLELIPNRVTVIKNGIVVEKGDIQVLSRIQSQGYNAYI